MMGHEKLTEWSRLTNLQVLLLNACCPISLHGHLSFRQLHHFPLCLLFK